MHFDTYFFLTNITHIAQSCSFLFLQFCNDKLYCRLMMQLFDPSIYCSYLLYIFLQVGKIKVAGLEILRIQCRNSVMIITNGIRKVRQGVDIFDKRILDSCNFISDRYLKMELTSWCLCIEPDWIKRIAHQACYY